MKWTREALVWRLGLVASVLGYLGTHTSLVPPAYAEVVKDVSSLFAAICGYLSASPLPFGGGPKPYTVFNGKDEQ